MRPHDGERADFDAATLGCCLRRGLRLAKARQLFRGATPMIGIGAIVLFLIVMGALNLYEFGRLD